MQILIVLGLIGGLAYLISKAKTSRPPKETYPFKQKWTEAKEKARKEADEETYSFKQKWEEAKEKALKEANEKYVKDVETAKKKGTATPDMSAKANSFKQKWIEAKEKAQKEAQS